MTLSVRVNGDNLVSFQTGRATRSIENLCGAFSFTSTAQENNLFPVRAGDEVEILAGGLVFITGFVDRSKVAYDTESHDISVNGRSKLEDLLDSSVGKTKEFKANATLESVARTVLNDLGLNKVEIINNAGTIEPFEDDTSAEVGQNAFTFLESYSRKRQVLLTEDELGRLVFDRATTAPSIERLQHKRNNDSNNIKSAELIQDLSGRFNKYTAQSQLNPLNQGAGIFAASIVDVNASASDSGKREDGTPAIRSSRILEFNTEESMNGTSVGDRVKWEANIRRTRSFQYMATVQGFTDSKGKIWAPNTLIHIEDEFSEIDADLLLRQVDFIYGLDGSISNLFFVKKDSYTLAVEQAQRESARSETGKGFLNF